MTGGWRSVQRRGAPTALRRVAFVGLAVAVGVALVRWSFAVAVPGSPASAAPPWPLFVPPILVLVVAAVLCARFPRLPPGGMALGLLLAAMPLVLAVPPQDLVTAVAYSPQDDGAEYLSQARFMYEHGTLMAGRPTFQTQPGYPYVLLPLLLLPGFPNRLHHIVMAVGLVLVVAVGARALHADREEAALRALMTAFPLLALPYFIKNLYMGLPEWLAFALMFVALALWRRGRVLPCAASLGAIAVLRQNLLVAAALLVATIVADAWRRGRHGVATLAAVVWAVLALAPGLHNVYYGGTVAILAGGRTLTFVDDWTRRPLETLGGTLVKYGGYSATASRPGLLFSLAGVPVGTALLLWLLARVASLGSTKALLFVGLVVSGVVPAALLGLAYYPRFELVNLGLACVGYAFVRDASLGREAIPAPGA